MVILELIRAFMFDSRRTVLIRLKTIPVSSGSLVIHNYFSDRLPLAIDVSFKFLPYQLSMVG